jgi:hypothetical protein
MCRTTMRQVQAETKVPQNKARKSSISAFSSAVRDKVIRLDHGDTLVGFCGSPTKHAHVGASSGTPEHKFLGLGRQSVVLQHQSIRYIKTAALAERGLLGDKNPLSPKTPPKSGLPEQYRSIISPLVARFQCTQLLNYISYDATFNPELQAHTSSGCCAVLECIVLELRSDILGSS